METVKNDSYQDKLPKSEGSLLAESDEQPQQLPAKIQKICEQSDEGVAKSNSSEDSENKLFKKSVESTPAAVDATCASETSASDIVSLLKEIKDNQIKFQKE